MQHVTVISTGGTISCVPDERGALVPALTAADLIERTGTTIPTRGVDVHCVDSSSMTLADVDSVLTEVHLALTDPECAGVVVTHGTDSLADTAYALQLFHDDVRPIVVTGAMTTDDGPGNLHDAVSLVFGGGANDVTVLVGGNILPAAGVIKHSLNSLSPFRANNVATPAPLPLVQLGEMNVPVIAAWPGAPADIVDAVVATHPHGIVVVGLGAGNVSADMGVGIARALEQAIPVVLTSCVELGSVEFAYGGTGGGKTLGELGAIASGGLRAGQARIALAAAAASEIDPRVLFPT